MRTRIVILAIALMAPAGIAAAQSPIILKNDAVLRELRFDGHVWRTVRFARADGSDELKVQSDEFHVLLLDDTEFSLDQYQAQGEPVREQKDGTQRVSIHYVPRAKAALPAVTITYTLGRDPYPRKTVQLTMKEGQAIDRLEVERFSVDVPAQRGGRGQPVFVNDTWWFGVEYPAFYSRHTDGNTPKWHEGYFAAFPSVIRLDDRDVEKHPRPGLIRLMHFPGSARKLADGSWGILGKTAVCGVREPGLTMELSFFDYLATIRKPVRSFLHYNNWYDGAGKKLSIENFVEKTFIPMRDALAPYGVKLDAMVPDDQWQEPRSIYEPRKEQFPGGWADVARLAGRLEKEGTRMGIWFALNGQGLNMPWGAEHGYKEAARNDNFLFYINMHFYALSDPKYNAAVREVLVRLLRDCRVNYFKHDFNAMCDVRPTGQPQTDRHGHEAEVDATLELLAMERRLNPDVYQNMTNWIWFSPWWLQACDTIFMLSGDDGLQQNPPQVSTLAMASLYRDVHLAKSWMLAPQRPLIPISHLMTVGIIYTQSLYGRGQESIRDFADYVMMYYVRGVKLKEWYITPAILTAEHWPALGTSTRWAVENQQTLANAILIGGKPAAGEPFGYVSWQGERGILAARNTQPGEMEITVPFDQSAFYRGRPGVDYRARVIYPYQAPWPGGFRSGEPMKLSIPGYSLLVMELEPGRASAAANPIPPDRHLPPVAWRDGRLTVPDEPMARCDLSLIGTAALTLDGQRLTPTRTNAGRGWQIAAFDLLPWRGKEVRLALACDEIFGADAQGEAWLLLDRPVVDAPPRADPRLPWPIAQGFRRQTMPLFQGDVKNQTPVRKMTADDWKQVRAAKVRIETFGMHLWARTGGKCQILIGDGKVLAEVPSNRQHDLWETQVLDVPAERLPSIAASNTLRVVRERDGGQFKFRGLTLAVQLRDGTWVHSSADRDVQSSDRNWRYFEGQLFPTPQQSQSVTLRFED